MLGVKRSWGEWGFCVWVSGSLGFMGGGKGGGGVVVQQGRQSLVPKPREAVLQRLVEVDLLSVLVTRVAQEH